MWVSCGRVTFSLLHRVWEKHELLFSRTRMNHCPQDCQLSIKILIIIIIIVKMLII